MNKKGIEKNAIKQGQLLQYLPYLAFAQALLAMLGSLYFSEIAKFPPCVLCWYQRICLYPLVVIMAVGIIRKDRKNMPYYVLPLSITGLVISVYHNLLYYKILPEAAAPCIAGVSCTTKFIEWFGFITIPSLALFAFAIMTTLMLILLRINRKV